uniref:Uncharacterized protein n=1 Tax=Oryza barthii TaxID=65489 RepID=A0A0D3GM01_9ORYZ
MAPPQSGPQPGSDAGGAAPRRSRGRGAPIHLAVLLQDPPQQAAVPDRRRAAAAAALAGGIGGAGAGAGDGALAAAFHLSKADLDRLTAKPSLFGSRTARLKIVVYAGRRGTTCGVGGGSGRLLGKVVIPLDLKGASAKPVVYHSSWICIGKRGRKPSSVSAANAQLNITVRAEPDPRFVFEFDGEPECSPQVLQVQGEHEAAHVHLQVLLPQQQRPPLPVKFLALMVFDQIPQSMPADMGSGGRNWLTAFGSDRERAGKERKGWVSKSNPGAWLVLRPGDGTWKPWGRLECWRERGAGAAAGDSLGYRFELVLPDPTGMGVGVSVAESTIPASKGGRFAIDLTATQQFGRSGSPACSPCGSGDYGMWPFGSCRGFVMSAAVQGEGKCSRPAVEVGVQNVGCAEDAAAFVALAAAVDLSMDACRLFSHRLRRELSASRSDLLR